MNVPSPPGGTPQSEFARMNKPREIEEFLDTYLIRPMGYGLVQILRHTKITPNMVSLAAVAAAICAAVAYYHRSLTGALLGLFFMLLTSALDSADGQLARATGRGTELGRLVDGLCDNLSFAAMYLAILFSWVHYVDRWFLAVFVIMWLAGISHSAQSALADYQRQLFLFYCYGKGGPESESPEALKERIRVEPSWFKRFMLRLHTSYAREQRWLLRSSDELQRRFDDLGRDRPALRAAFAERYRAANTTLVKWWALGATNIHKFGIAASAFLPVLFASGPLHELGMVAHFLWDIALNLPIVALILVQRRSDRRLLAELETMTRP